MSWDTVYDWLRRHTCYEAQHTGTCSCPACKRTRAAMNTIIAFSIGTPTTGTIAQVIAVVHSKRCFKSQAGHHCNHKGCVTAEQVIEFLSQTERKAA